jgi:hypothetical protein
MNNKLFYFLCICVLFSCEKKTDPTPIPVADPVLKGYVTETNYVNFSDIYRSHYNIKYDVKGDFSSIQSLDTTFKTALNRIIRYFGESKTELLKDAQGNYQLIDYSTNDNDGPIPSSYSTKTTATLKKVGNNYESAYSFTALSVTNGTNMSLQINETDQIVSCKGIKFTSIDFNGKLREFPFSSVARYEYDANGNVVKVFEKLDDSSPEFLKYEFTYDQKKKPFKSLKWYNRLVSLSNTLTGISEANNNIMTSKTYDSKTGVVSSETTNIYTYDSTQSFPLSVTSTTKSNGAITSKSKTTFKY